FMLLPPSTPTLFPYTTLFRSRHFARIHQYIVSAPCACIVIWGQEKVEQQEDIYILNVKSGEIRELPMPDLPKYRPALSPDGKLMVFVGAAERGSQLFQYDMAAGEIHQLRLKEPGIITQRFVSDPEILFGSDRGGPRGGENETHPLDLTVKVWDKEKKKDKKKKK